MLKNKIVISAVILVIVPIQAIANSSFEWASSSLSFANVCFDEYGVSGFVLLLMRVYTIIPFIMFLFWGESWELYNGYSKLLVVRNYNRAGIILRLAIRTALRIVLIGIYIYIIYSLVDRSNNLMGIENQIRIMIMYCFTILAIILMTYLLELFMMPQYAYLVVNIFIILSLFVKTCMDNSMNLMLSIFCFPNLAYTCNNGLGISSASITFPISLIAVVLICTLLTIQEIIIYKNRDVF